MNTVVLIASRLESENLKTASVNTSSLPKVKRIGKCLEVVVEEVQRPFTNSRIIFFSKVVCPQLALLIDTIFQLVLSGEMPFSVIRKYTNLFDSTKYLPCSLLKGVWGVGEVSQSA